MRIQVNGTDRDVVVGRLLELLIELGHDPAAKGIAVALNGQVVRRADWSAEKLRAGDRIEIVGAAQGG